MIKKLLFALLFLLNLNLNAQDIYTNQKFGFSILEPKGWQKELNRDNNFNLDISTGRRPVTFYKYERGKNNEINSTVNITVANNSSKPQDFIKRMLKPNRWAETYYLTHSFAKEPEVVKINGKDAVTATVHFTYNSHGTKKTSFRKRIYYILENKKCYKIVFIDDHNLDVDSKLFDEMINSFKINQ